MLVEETRKKNPIEAWSFIQGHKAFLNARITCEKFFKKLRAFSSPASERIGLAKMGLI